jgi:hypothetical protein
MLFLLLGSKSADLLDIKDVIGTCSQSSKMFESTWSSFNHSEIKQSSINNKMILTQCRRTLLPPALSTCRRSISTLPNNPHIVCWTILAELQLVRLTQLSVCTPTVTYSQCALVPTHIASRGIARHRCYIADPAYVRLLTRESIVYESASICDSRACDQGS